MWVRDGNGRELIVNSSMIKIQFYSVHEIMKTFPVMSIDMTGWCKGCCKGKGTNDLTPRAETMDCLYPVLLPGGTVFCKNWQPRWQIP